MAKGNVPPRLRLIGYGLMIAGALIWNEGPLTAWYSGLLFIGAVAALVLHHVQPQVLQRVPRLDDPATRIEILVLVLFVVGILRAGAFIGFFVYMAGWFLFARDAIATGEVRHVDPRAFLRMGWLPRVIAVGVFLALLILAGEWDGRFSTTSSYTSGDFRYTTTHTTEASNGYETGDSPWLALLLVPVALWLVWDKAREWKWGRYVPFASIAVASAWALYILIDDYRFVQELHEIGGGYPKFQAAGPTWFLLACIPALIAAGLLAFRGPKEQAPGAAGTSEPSD